MKLKHISIIFILIMSIFIVACMETKEQDINLKGTKLVLPQTPYNYDLQFPFIENNIATLGRVLFYDKVLSINNTVSCATCHKQELAFSDDKAFSIGFGDQLTLRNSMAIINPGSRQNGFFWDLRELFLDNMVIKPLQNHIEMGFDNMDHVVKKISATNYYPNLFKNAFGTTEITQSKIQQAISGFLQAMNSNNSKYDLGINNNFTNFTSQELLGMDLVTEKLYCKFCHSGRDFRPEFYQRNGGGGANIGLEMSYLDKGIKLPTTGIQGEGFFKIPSLRNVELTAPYMHDGRFKTLEEVVEHYSTGVQNHPNLSDELKREITVNGGFILHKEAVKLNLTDGDKKAIVAFLKTLTDYKFITDEKFSSPFKAN